jgi:maleylacetoacetate isomerase/maleylpyruvate isomerase
MKLYSYPKSTTSYRVRAALNLKGVAYDIVQVDLRDGVQRSDDFQAINPAKGIPVLVLDNGTILTQSMVILDYLDAAYPDVPMLPADPMRRVRMLSLAMIIATDIHPVNNLRVVGQLKQRFGASSEQCQEWMQHWMSEGFAAVEALLPDESDFAFSDKPMLVDICITAQVYNAHRWGVDLTPFPKIARIERACLAVPEIAAAHPDYLQNPKDDE